jgi:transmembrane sensor
MQNAFIYNLIAKKFSEEISEQEKLKLDKWINEKTQNKKLYEKLSSIWQKAVNTNIDFEPEIEKAIIVFKERVKRSERQKQRRVIQLRITQIAASIVILLGFSLFLIQNLNTVKVVTDNLGLKQIILPDSSTILLNRNTKIKYKKAFENRIVELDGEAFFEVKKQNGKPFTVKSNSTYTRVLGTSFNIKSRKRIDNNVQVFVLTGKVEFGGKNKEKSVILSPNQQAVYKNKISEIGISESVDPNLLAWKTGILKFENKILKDVLETLKDVYGIEYEVVTIEMLDLKVTCEFDNANIEDILADIEKIIPVKIHLNNNLITIENLR